MRPVQCKLRVPLRVQVQKKLGGAKGCPMTTKGPPSTGPVREGLSGFRCADLIPITLLVAGGGGVFYFPGGVHSP